MFHDLGYLGLTLAVLLSCCGIPLPNEIILAVAGVAVQRGELDLATAVTLATAGQLVGLAISYLIGRHEGDPFVDRFGRYLFINHAMVMRVRRLFKRDGAPIVLAGLLLPVLHGGMGFWAGFGGVKPRLFVPLVVVATPVYTLMLVALGMLAGDKLPAFIGVFRGATGVSGAVAVVLVAAYVWYSRRKAAHAATRNVTRRPTRSRT